MKIPKKIIPGQTIRLYDMLILGPSMIYIGYKENLKPLEKILLIGGGIGTILVNGGNYLKNTKLFENTSFKLPHEIVKPQYIRIWDVLVLGPAMVYIGFNKNLQLWQKILLVGSGAGIIALNGLNYFKFQPKKLPGVK